MGCVSLRLIILDLMTKIAILYSAIFCSLQLAYAQHAVKIVSLKMEYDIQLVNNNLLITSVESIEKEVLDMSRAKAYEVKENVYSDAFSTIEFIDARTVYEEKGRQKTKRANGPFPTEDVVSSGIFYGDTKLTTIALPAVSTGSHLFTTVKMKYDKPQLLTPFTFTHFLPMDHVEFVIRCDKEVQLAFTDFYFGFEDKIQFSESLESGRNVYRWKAENMAPWVDENNAGGVSCHEPHVVFRITEFGANGDQHVFRDKADLFEWYSGLIEEQEIGDNYQYILDSLKATSNDQEVVARNIFKWVQHNIEYIAYEDGMGGFIPRTPSSVIANRYGDCKDMAMLTKTMMTAAGLKCYLAWVGTRDKCYTYDNCPTPIVDNHMIAAYSGKNGLVFIDPTSTFSEFGVPSSFIQGKEAMVRMAPDQFEIIEVPKMDAGYSVKDEVFDCRIEDSRVLGSGTVSVTGFQKIQMQYQLNYKSYSDEEMFSWISEVGNESYTVSNVSIKNQDNNTDPLEAEFDFILSNHFTKYNDASYLNPFLVQVVDFDTDERKLDLQLDYTYVNKAHIRWHLPENTAINVDDFNWTVEENGLTLRSEATYENNILDLQYAFENNLYVLEAGEVSNVKGTLRKMKKQLKHQIEIK